MRSSHPRSVDGKKDEIPKALAPSTFGQSFETVTNEYAIASSWARVIVFVYTTVAVVTARLPTTAVLFTRARTCTVPCSPGATSPRAIVTVRSTIS